MSYLMDSSYMHTIRSSPLLMMFAREAILLLKSWCSFSPFFYFYVLFYTMSFRYLSRLYFTLNPISCEAMWCLYCFWSYTVKFDKVEQEKIVEKVSDLPDPVVCNSFFWSNGGFVVFFWVYRFSLFNCSLIQLSKKHLMWHMTIYMHFMLLRNLLREVLRTWKSVNIASWLSQSHLSSDVILYCSDFSGCQMQTSG